MLTDMTAQPLATRLIFLAIVALCGAVATVLASSGRIGPWINLQDVAPAWRWPITAVVGAFMLLATLGLAKTLLLGA